MIQNRTFIKLSTHLCSYVVLLLSASTPLLRLLFHLPYSTSRVNYVASSLCNCRNGGGRISGFVCSCLVLLSSFPHVHLFHVSVSPSCLCSPVNAVFFEFPFLHTSALVLWTPRLVTINGFRHAASTASTHGWHNLSSHATVRERLYVSRATAAVMATWPLRVQLSCCIEYVFHSFEIVEPGLLYAALCKQNVLTACRNYCVHFNRSSVILLHLYITEVFVGCNKWFHFCRRLSFL